MKSWNHFHSETEQSSEHKLQMVIRCPFRVSLTWLSNVNELKFNLSEVFASPNAKEDFFITLDILLQHFSQQIFSGIFHRNEVNDKNTNGGPRRSLQRSATLPANPRNNPIIRHHQRYHHDEQSAEIPVIQQQPQTRFNPQRIKIRVKSTSTEKAAGDSNNNQNVSDCAFVVE